MGDEEVSETSWTVGANNLGLNHVTLACSSHGEA
jgi:hypothetical protein